MNWLVLILIPLLLACDQKLDWVDCRDDTVVSASYVKENGIVVGWRRTYIVYGKFRFTGATLEAGMASEPTKVVRFRIKDLITTNPELDNPFVQEAITAQERQLDKLNK